MSANIPETHDYDIFDWFWAQETAVSETSNDTPSAPPSPNLHQVAPEEHNWDTWTDNPFDFVCVPIGALLEPEGYAAMRGLKQRRTTSYTALMPRTYAVAQAIYDSVEVRDVWGQHLISMKAIAKKDDMGRSLVDVSWKTHTAGKWIDSKYRKANKTCQAKPDAPNRRPGAGGFPDSPLGLLDVIKTLADPNAYAVGSKDVWDWRRPESTVKNIRIDIDLDRVFDASDLTALQGEMEIVHKAFSAFGLAVRVMRTGNRGIQAMATIPPMPRAHAGMLVHALRQAIRGAPRCWLAKDFQSNLDGIMRLPLGRHAWTKSVSCMLAQDASVLPLERQAEAVVSGLCGPTTMGDAWVEGVGAFLASRRIYPWAAVPETLLTAFSQEQPENGLVRLLDDACVCVGAPPFGNCPPRLALSAAVSSQPCNQVAPDQDTVDARTDQSAVPKHRIPVKQDAGLARPQRRF